MRKFTKIYHSAFEVNEDETRYYLVLIEVCLLSYKVIGTYTSRLPDWVADNDNPDYKFYQPIFN
jgi:hypothetical protein